MDSVASRSSAPIGLEDLVALNEEIAALARAGIPLELGLRGNAFGLRKRLAALSERLRIRSERGESLDEAIAAEGDDLPPAYRVIVTAGLRTGRLTEALESLARFGRNMNSLRQQLHLAMLYPAIVLLVAYGLSIFVLHNAFPVLESQLRDFDIDTGICVRGLRFLHRTLPIWVPGLPLLVTLGLLLLDLSRHEWIMPSRSGNWSLRRMVGSVIRMTPWLGSIIANNHRANFVDLLAQLVEHEVPLEEAVVLAGDGCGDPAIAKGARSLSLALGSGRDLSESLRESRGLPRFMAWMIGAGQQQGALPETLRQLTSIYRRRARFQAEWFQLVVPMLLVVVVGGCAVLLYAMALFVPLTNLLDGLS